MAVIKPYYGTAGQAITITLNSLANNAFRASLAIANTQWRDVLVQLIIKTGASGGSSGSVLNVYAYGSADGGSHYSDGIGGTDAVVTPTANPNFVFLGFIACPSNATTYTSHPMNVAHAFGGVMPPNWGIVVENKFGGGLDSTAGNFSAFYQGISDQAV